MSVRERERMRGAGVLDRWVFEGVDTMVGCWVDGVG